MEARQAILPGEMAPSSRFRRGREVVFLARGPIVGSGLEE